MAGGGGDGGDGGGEMSRSVAMQSGGQGCGGGLGGEGRGKSQGNTIVEGVESRGLRKASAR